MIIEKVEAIGAIRKGLKVHFPDLIRANTQDSTQKMVDRPLKERESFVKVTLPEHYGPCNSPK